MNNTIFRSSLLGFSVLPAVVGAGSLTANPDDRPNIVVIVADDLASYELSCYGGQNLTTPNIDRLAAEGVRFTNNYASCAMSVPIRASMYTGLYPVRHGSYQNHKNTYPGTKSITHYMPETGYRLGRTGKRHPGGAKGVYNFEEIPGFTVNCVSTTADYSVDGIREFMLRSEDPFCLFVCSIHPHAPWTWGDPDEFDRDKLVMSPQMVDTPGMREIFARYLAEVRSLDNEVGSVLDVLTEIGELDNTVVIFLGEQGPQYPGAKWTCWNPGQNSALVARYPSRIKAGSVNDAIVQYEDVLPTLLDIAGGDMPEGIDGRSFKEVLFDPNKEHRKYAYGIHNNIPEGTAYPIRSIRDKRYKLILNLTPEADYYEKHLMNPNAKAGPWVEWNKGAEASGQGRFIRDRFVHRPAVEFYDMQEDPFEMDNLAGQKKYRKKIATLTAELYRWMEQQNDTGAAMDAEFVN